LTAGTVSWLAHPEYRARCSLRSGTCSSSSTGMAGKTRKTALGWKTPRVTKAWSHAEGFRNTTAYATASFAPRACRGAIASALRAFAAFAHQARRALAAVGVQDRRPAPSAAACADKSACPHGSQSAQATPLGVAIRDSNRPARTFPAIQPLDLCHTLPNRGDFDGAVRGMPATLIQGTQQAIIWRRSSTKGLRPAPSFCRLIPGGANGGPNYVTVGADLRASSALLKAPPSAS